MCAYLLDDNFIRSGTDIAGNLYMRIEPFKNASTIWLNKQEMLGKKGTVSKLDKEGMLLFLEEDLWDFNKIQNWYLQ